VKLKKGFEQIHFKAGERRGGRALHTYKLSERKGVPRILY